ncbi:MAG: hypothetical protein ACK5K7_03480 [Bacilli bacterium]
MHRSFTSQIAEAINNILANDIFESYLAAIETKSQINQDVIRLIKHPYKIDMEVKLTSILYKK